MDEGGKKHLVATIHYNYIGSEIPTFLIHDHAVALLNGFERSLHMCEYRPD